MKVVHIIKIVLTAGAERHLLRLLPGLQANGIDVHLIVLVQPDKPMDDFVALATDAGISVERITIHRHADVALLPRLARRLRHLQPDVVHTHLIHADLYGVLAARLVGVRGVVISRHNDNAFRYHPAARLLNRMLWRLSSRGIAISEALRQFCISVESANPHSVTKIHYGLDLPRTDVSNHRAALRRQLNSPHDAILLGTVSRLIEQKGLQYIISAMSQLRNDYANLFLVITGDGALRSDLKTQVANAGLQDRVRFLGWREDADAVMAGLDVFVQPSLWEGFGLVLLEAMARDLPIIATHVSAIPEIVQDGETGLLVPPKDAAALADAVRQLVDDPQLRQKMGEAGRTRLDNHFSEAKMVEATAELYRSLTAGE